MHEAHSDRYMAAVRAGFALSHELNRATGPVHFLAGIAQGEGPAAEALRITPRMSVRAAAATCAVPDDGSMWPHLQAQQTARAWADSRSEQVQPEHLLVALLDQNAPDVREALQLTGIDARSVRREVLQAIGVSEALPTLASRHRLPLERSTVQRYRSTNSPPTCGVCCAGVRSTSRFDDSDTVAIGVACITSSAAPCGVSPLAPRSTPTRKARCTTITSKRSSVAPSQPHPTSSTCAPSQTAANRSLATRWRIGEGATADRAGCGFRHVRRLADLVQEPCRGSERPLVQTDNTALLPRAARSQDPTRISRNPMLGA